MCIAIYKNKDLVIPKETLEQCFKANPDGAGFMYSKNKELFIHKGFFTFKDFYSAYKHFEKEKAVLHFRIKTHGKIDVDNCHPFHIHKGLGFVHNGIISGFGASDASDTSEFNENILKPLVQKWGNLALFQPAIKQLVESRIGYSKLVFLDRHGNVEIFNENKGVWDTGIWYSNSSYKKPEPTPITPLPQQPFRDYYGNRYIPNLKTKEYFKIGDLVILRKGYYDQTNQKYYTSDDFFEIAAVNKDYTCDLLLDDGSKNPEFLYNIQFHMLEFWDYSSTKEINYGAI